MVVGAHTMHHVSLIKVSLALAKAEIDGSKAYLEQLLGEPVLDFAYPYGTNNAAVDSLVAAAGFRDAAATSWGTLQCTANRYALHRLEIMGSFSVSAFAVAAGVAAPPPNWTDPGLITH